MEGLWFVANATQNGERQSIQQIADPAAAAANVQGLERNISAQTWPGLNYFFSRTESAARAHRIGDAAAQQTQGVAGVHRAAVRGTRDKHLVPRHSQRVQYGSPAYCVVAYVGPQLRVPSPPKIARAVPPWLKYLGGGGLEGLAETRRG